MQILASALSVEFMLSRAGARDNCMQHPAVQIGAVLLRFREVGVVIDNIAADQFPDHGAYKYVGREVIKATDPGEANRCSQPIRSEDNQRFIAIFPRHDGGEGKRAHRMT